MPAPRSVPRAGDGAVAIDGAATLMVGVAICLASDRLAFMTALVPVVLAGRCLAWSRLPLRERGISLSSEAGFLVLCFVLGAGNDWNSVVRHRVYDYTAARSGPSTNGIPFWMLLYWALIVRFIATLCRWRRLGAPSTPRDDLHVGGCVASSAALKIAVELGLVVATRRLIYAYYLHPVFSWLPFAGALFFYAGLFGLTRHDMLLLAVALGGSVAEVLFIQVGGLHRYHLAWVGGLPAWIVLWWMLAVLIWNDLSARLLALFARGAPVKRPLPDTLLS